MRSDLLRFTSAILICFLVSVCAHAERDQHVWLDVLGGSLDGNGLFGGVARYSTPVVDPVETQVEFALGGLDGKLLYGLEGHVFFREGIRSNRRARLVQSTRRRH